MDNKKKPKKLRDQIKSIKVDTFTKILVAFIVIMAVIDLQLSYVLAFFDKIQIAEELSKQVCTTILGVAFVYMVRAYYDSKAEYGDKNKNNSLRNQINKFIKAKTDAILTDAAGTDLAEIENNIADTYTENNDEIIEENDDYFVDNTELENEITDDTDVEVKG